MPLTLAYPDTKNGGTNQESDLDIQRLQDACSTAVDESVSNRLAGPERAAVLRIEARLPRNTAIAIGMRTSKLKVLFFAEGATLAHVARPWVLARGLDPTRFNVTVARPRAFRWLTTDATCSVIDLECQDATTFARRLDRGMPLYDYPTLSGYVSTDLALIDAIKPDVVVGDFRLSLSVSARLRSVPYITICDAYWSPERSLRAPLPVLSFTHLTPIPLAEWVFRRVAGPAFRLHARPLERLRKHHGLPSLGFDLRRVYSDADLRLFANFPALFPEIRASPAARFIGPITWSPQPQDQRPFVDGDEPLAYVTMGSSGDTRVLATIIPTLEEYGFQIALASAGRALPPHLNSAKTRIFDYLPGALVCRRASLVVCNGGSPTTNQALACGVPVLGITHNMDQFLNMQAIEAFGAGIMIRADRARRAATLSAVKRLRTDSSFTNRAQLLAETLDTETSITLLVDNISRILSANSRAT